MSKTIKIPGRLESAETGKVVAGANAILDDTKGKKQNVINEETDAELLRLDQEKQGNLTFDQTPTEDSTNPVTSGGVYAADQMLSQAIEAILLLIPSAASELNKLVDLATMNSSISTATASFKGTYNLVSDLHLTVSATHAQIAAALDDLSLGADNNDYAFVQVPNTDTAPTDIAKTERYKFNGENWAYEYDLNNSGFTTAQWNAINSGITTLLVAKLLALPTNEALTLALAGKQDNLTFDNVPTADSNNPVKSSGIYTRNNEIVALINALDAAKQNVLTFDTTPTNGSTNPVTSNGVYLAIQLVQTAVVALDGRMGTAETKISTAEGNIVNLQAAYAALTQSDIVVVSGALPSSGQQQNIIYRQPDQDHTPPQFYSDYMWNGTAWVLMATYNNAIDPRPKKGSQNLVTSGGVFDNMGALDVSELNATENPHTLKPYATLDAALADIPSDYQKGGMSIKYVQTSDNKYIQFRYMGTDVTTAATFTNVVNWQGVDDVPTAGSDNLVKSGGAKKEISLLRNIKSYTDVTYMAIDCIVDIKVWVSTNSYIDCGIATFGVYNNMVILLIRTASGASLSSFTIVDSTSYPSSGIVTYKGYNTGANKVYYIKITIDWSKFTFDGRFNADTPQIVLSNVETFKSNSYFLETNSIIGFNTFENKSVSLSGISNYDQISDEDAKGIANCITNIECWIKDEYVNNNTYITTFGVYGSQFLIYLSQMINGNLTNIGTFVLIDGISYPSSGIVTYFGQSTGLGIYHLKLTIDWSQYDGYRFNGTDKIQIAKVSSRNTDSFYLQTTYIKPLFDNLSVAVFGSDTIYEYVVDINGSGDYVSLRECVDHCNTLTNNNSANITPKFIIKIKPGTYNIRSYYTNEEWTESGFVGLSLPRNCQIIGLGKKRSDVLITCTAETATSDISTLNFRDDTYVENVTIYGENLRYTIHDDYSSYIFANKYYNHREIKNVDFIGKNLQYSMVYGAGDGGGARWKFEDCRFINKTCLSCFSVHDRNSAEGQTVADEYKFKNCQFIGYPVRINYKQTIDFAPLLSGCENRAEFIGCTFSSIRIYMDSVSGHTSTSSIRITGHGNNKDYVVVYSTESAKAMTPRFSDEILEGFNTGASDIEWGDYVIAGEDNALSKGTEQNHTGIAIDNIPVGEFGAIKLT